MEISKFTKWMITLSVMLVAIIEILDMTIVNVALPNMMGELGANSEEITWVLTSYIVSSAIVMPLTGFLVGYFGRKKLLYINVIGFLIASMVCGAATSLASMVFFRMLQGIFGASLVPLSQYILRDTYPPSEHGKAMAIWGIGVMVGPVMGPTLGGYITEWLNWRWIFYINIPVCLIALGLIFRYITETPVQKVKIDFVGLFLMASGVGALQVFLDRGNSSDWFSSNFILITAIITTLCLIIFIVRGIHKKDNIINLHMFKNANFSVSTFLLSLFCAGMIGIISIQPILLETLMNYTTENAGLVMAPRGIASAIAMFIAGALIQRVHPRWLLFAGILISAYGMYLMTNDNLQTSFKVLAWQGCVQGFGMGLFFVPLSTLALSTLPENQIAEGAGLFSFGRSLGCSIGISILSTIITRESQINWHQLGGHVSLSSPNFQRWLALKHWRLDDPKTIAHLGNEVYQQASMIAFTDVFWIVTASFIAMIPLIFLLKKGKATSAPAGH